MGSYKEIEGDLIKLAQQGEFDVITHGCNCHCVMGAGIAPQMAKAFGCDKYQMEDIKYRGDINKLGTIDYKTFVFAAGTSEFDIFDFDLTIVNSYTQYNYGANHKDGVLKPIDYDALTLCMRKINNKFSGKRIGLPKIGAGLAGGLWDINELSQIDIAQMESKGVIVRDIKSIIMKELKDCDVTVVIFKK